MDPESNPFRSPQTDSEPLVGGDGAAGRDAIPFESCHNRAMWAVCLLAIVICLDLVDVGSSYLRVQFINRVLQGDALPEELSESNDGWQPWPWWIAIGQFLAVFGTAIAFSMWFHRAHRNLPAMGARGLKYSPRWAVGGFFVPILNLFRPYQVMKEVWRGSDPAPASIQASDPKFARVSPLVGWWWALWILNALVGQISVRVETHTASLRGLRIGVLLEILGDLVSLSAAMVAIVMIRGVDANQERRNRIVNHVGEAQDAWPE